VWENFFAVEVGLFSLRSGRCLLLCMVFLRLLAGVLWCVSTWLVVRFKAG
jgi:hypothetical protein